MTKLNEEKREALLQGEQNILQAVLGAAQDMQDTEIEVEIIRGKKFFFGFHIKALTHTAYEEAREKATKYKIDKRGRKVIDDYSMENAQARLIYAATSKVDREKIWDNKELWAKLNVLTAHQVIPKVLLPGEMTAVVESIDDLSGFSLNADDMAVKKREERDELKN